MRLEVGEMHLLLELERARVDSLESRAAGTRRSLIGRLIREGLRLGTTVFGGLNQAYPLIREGGWLPASEVDGLYAVSVFLPGPSFINLWGSIAARAAGLTGAILAQAALLLPSFLLVLTLPLLTYIPWVAERTSGALLGSTWATAGILISTGLGQLRRQKGSRQWWLATGALGLLLLGVHPLAVLAGSVAFGVAVGADRRASKGAN